MHIHALFTYNAYIASFKSPNLVYSERVTENGEREIKQRSVYISTSYVSHKQGCPDTAKALLLFLLCHAFLHITFVRARAI